MMKRLTRWMSHAGIRVKLLQVFLGMTLLLLIPMVFLGIWNSQRQQEVAEEQVVSLIDADLAHIADAVHDLIRTHAEAVQAKVNTDLQVAHYIIEESGGLNICEGHTYWNAVNQYTDETYYMQLPRICVGDRWLGHYGETRSDVLVVDTLQDLTGSTATIFQPMNENGDLLRIATNILKSETERAINTYIPATNPDGTPNPVITSIMRGETFYGLAYVWNDWYVTVYEPMYDDDDNLLAVLYVGVRREEFGSLYNTLQNIQIGETGYVYVLGGEGEDRGTYIVSENGERDGEYIYDTQATDGRFIIQELIDEALALDPGETYLTEYGWRNPGDDQDEIARVRVAYYEPWDWVIGFKAYERDYADFYADLSGGTQQAVISTIGISLGAAALAGIVIWIVAGAISRPLSQVATAADSLAVGDFSQRVDIKGNDETGVLARGFNTMAGSLQNMIETERANARTMEETVANYMQFVERVSDGDLTVRLDVEQVAHEDLSRLGLHLNAMVERLTEMAAQVRDTSSEMLATSNDLQSAATEQASTSAEQDAAVTQTLNMVEEMNTSVQQTAQSVAAVARAAQDSLEVSQSGQLTVQEAINGMEEIMRRVNSIAETIQMLAEGSQQIGEIIETVREIADQSKLLALNASIEAARAGEQGQGFAVVSMEVRELAEQSQRATARISDILHDIQTSTQAAVQVSQAGSEDAQIGLELVAHTGEAIQSLAQVIEEAAQEVAQIAGTTQHQSDRMDQLAAAMTAIKQSSAQAATTAAQADQSARELSEVAHDMQNAAARYTL